MKLKRDKVEQLLNLYCGGNYNRFAREIGVDPSHIFRFIKKGIGAGSKLIGGIMRFCKEKRLDYEQYIEL